MSRIFVHGVGAVSPAGWGMAGLREVLGGERSLQPMGITRPDGRSLPSFRVPAMEKRPAWATHPRMRRSSPISQFALAAALEALGCGETPASFPGLAILVSVMGGSVQYSRRFFGEVLVDPSTASPMLFPETVFNAPASHLGAVLGTRARNDTHVADQSGFLACLATAANWLQQGIAESCLVVACEEADWTTAEAVRLFSKGTPASEGAAALVLKREPSPVELTAVSSPYPTLSRTDPKKDLDQVIRELQPEDRTAYFACGCRGTPPSLDLVVGEGLAALGGWTCVAAVDTLMRQSASSSIALAAGANLQTLGARFQLHPKEVQE